jgi:deoxyribonuclease-4
MNFATNNPNALAQAAESLTQDLKDCEALGGKGVIFHLGSHKGRGLSEVIDQIVHTLSNLHFSSVTGEVLESVPWIVIENSAGMGGSIGSKFAELGQIVRQLPSDRVKVCLDTQHAFAAGYAIHTQGGLDETLQEFEREIGLDRLVVLHCNDSKIVFGGGVDRHENIGDGQIGTEGLRRIVQHPKLQNLPFLLEVPGVDHRGPDKDNVDRLRGLSQT